MLNMICSLLVIDWSVRLVVIYCYSVLKRTVKYNSQLTCYGSELRIEEIWILSTHMIIRYRLEIKQKIILKCDDCEIIIFVI